MAVPPVDAGGVHARVMLSLPPTAEVRVGGPGTVDGTDVRGSLLLLGPLMFIARTLIV
jgi:hypothetical protein